MGLALKGRASTPSPALVPRAPSPQGEGHYRSLYRLGSPPGVQPKIWVKISPRGEDALLPTLPAASRYEAG